MAMAMALALALARALARALVKAIVLVRARVWTLALAQSLSFISLTLSTALTFLMALE